MLPLAAACSKDGGDGGATPAAAASGRPDGANGVGGARGGPGGGPGGAGGRSITLAASDVATVARGSIEDATPVTGDLRPIETVDIRARLEGDLEAVYVREGERVRAGQLLARFESSQEVSGYQSAVADRAAAQSELATAQWNLEQSEELFKAGAIPERDVKVAQQAVASAKARVAAAEARIRSTGSGVSDTRVLATTNGVISGRTVDRGEHVARGTVLFTLVRNDVLELEAKLPARRASTVAPGQVVHFTADGRQFDGRVARVSPTIDPATRSVSVYVQVPNQGGLLKGGTFAAGRVVASTKRDVILIPTTAIRQGQEEGSSYVYKIEGQTLSQARVRLGVVDDQREMAEVVDGLQEGDRIVVGNVGTLGSGMRVEIIGGETGGGGRGGGRAGVGRPEDRK